MMKLLNDWFTERDNISFCLGRAIGGASGAAAIYKFLTATGAPDFVSFGTCAGAIIAAIAAKNWSEK